MIISLDSQYLEAWVKYEFAICNLLFINAIFVSKYKYLVCYSTALIDLIWDVMVVVVALYFSILSFIILKVMNLLILQVLVFVFYNLVLALIIWQMLYNVPVV